MDDRFYTVKEVAELLKVSEKHIRRLVHSRQLAVTIIGKCWRIYETNLQRYLAKQTSKVRENR